MSPIKRHVAWDAKQVPVSDLNLRVRAGMKATYGPDSTQSGGVRRRARASGLHRATKPDPAK